MKSKNELTDELLAKIKRITRAAIERDDFERALASLSFIGEYLYQYNQFYVEDELEKILCDISNKLGTRWHRAKYDVPSKRILFYDGFGLDTRGVVLMYLNALGLNDYQVTYVTNKKVRNQIPTIEAMCSKFNFEMLFIDFENYVDWAHQLSAIFEDVKPKAAFFYTTPFDASGIVAFHMYEGLADRYLIDLTDHAFWLGKSAVDYFLGSRNMSAALQFYHRGIKKKQMIKLGVNLLVESSGDHSGLPFNPIKTDYIFSGGSLYKTLGDKENRFYRIIDYILENHKNICFLYAGTGNKTEINKIIAKYPDRAFIINERKDFYYLIQNCLLYLNTFPMFGGMMMKYCGLAGKLPITLKHNNDSDGLLLHQAECNIEYDSYEELVIDIDKLIDDVEYRKSREALLEGSVITEERFKNNVRGVIENHKTDYEHEFEDLDTSTFRREYYERFNYTKQMMTVANKRNIPIAIYFPIYFCAGLLKKVLKKIKKIMKKGD